MEYNDFVQATGELARIKKYWAIGLRDQSRKVAKNLNQWLHRRGFKLIRGKGPGTPEMRCISESWDVRIKI